MANDTRERILISTAELFRRQGYNGTGLKQIVEQSKAPFGSVYHHFPGGKEELAAEVIRTAGAFYGHLVPALYDDAGDLIAATREAFRLAGVHLEESDWVDACPIATVTLETASESEPLRQASAEVFEGWVSELAPRLERHGLHAEAARRSAIGLICALEGAFVLARAWRTTEPLRAAGEMVAAQLEAELQAVEQAA